MLPRSSPVTVSFPAALLRTTFARKPIQSIYASGIASVGIVVSN